MNFIISSNSIAIPTIAETTSLIGSAENTASVIFVHRLSYFSGEIIYLPFALSSGLDRISARFSRLSTA